jgi:hypothetical protein
VVSRVARVVVGGLEAVGRVVLVMVVGGLEAAGTVLVLGVEADQDVEEARVVVREVVRALEAMGMVAVEEGAQQKVASAVGMRVAAVWLATVGGKEGAEAVRVVVAMVLARSALWWPRW